MIAFYVWTDTLLLNAVRVKESFFSAEDADLIVLKLDRVSEELLEEIRRLDVFARVVELENIVPDAPSALYKLTKLLRRRAGYRKLTDQLSSLSGTQYRLLLTGGFWSYFLFVYRYFTAWSPALDIAFLEEGAASYNGRESLLRCDPLGRTRSELYRCFYYSDIFPAACARAKTLYLFCPQAALNSEGLECVELPRSSPKAAALMEMLSSRNSLDEYRRREVIFFLQPEPDADIKTTLFCINAAVEEFGAENILVKTHPSQQELAWLEDLPAGVCLDHTGVPFTCFVDTVDWQDKVLIAKGTSCLLYPFYICRQEPITVFTYDLYPLDQERNVPAALAERLKTLYADRSRVLSADNSAEYSRILSTSHQKARL